MSVGEGYFHLLRFVFFRKRHFSCVWSSTVWAWIFRPHFVGAQLGFCGPSQYSPHYISTNLSLYFDFDTYIEARLINFHTLVGHNLRRSVPYQNFFYIQGSNLKSLIKKGAAPSVVLVIYLFVFVCAFTWEIV